MKKLELYGDTDEEQKLCSELLEAKLDIFQGVTELNRKTPRNRKTRCCLPNEEIWRNKQSSEVGAIRYESVQ